MRPSSCSRGGKVYEPITPPPFFVTATTLGRGGDALSGHLLMGFFMVLPLLACWLAGVLDGDEQRRRVRRELQARGLGSRGPGEEAAAGGRGLGPCDRHRVDAVVQSECVPGWPSVAIQRLPPASKAMLSGDEIWADLSTWSKPAK